MDNLKERFFAEFADLENKSNIIFCISPLEAWILFSNLQLALRHPENKGASSKIAIDLAKRIQDLVASEGALSEVAEMGWLPEYDEGLER